jgi:regulator of RNase E activity RraA
MQKYFITEPTGEHVVRDANGIIPIGQAVSQKLMNTRYKKTKRKKKRCRKENILIELRYLSSFPKPV